MKIALKILCVNLLLVFCFIGTLISPSKAAPPPPSVTIYANPTTIQSGASSLLTWGTKKAATASIGPGNEAIPLNGSMEVFPSTTTTYTITAAGSTGSSSANVTVVVITTNNAPIAFNDSAVTGEDESVVIDVISNDTDGDGNTLSVEFFNQPVNGTVTNNGDGTLDYAPNENFNGIENFNYTVNDGSGGTCSATVSIIVIPVNDPPLADPQSLRTTQDASLNITLSGSDVDSDPLNFVINSNPQNGALRGIASDVTYTPNQDFIGTDAFTFSVSDGIAESDPVTISIEVIRLNNAPRAVNDSTTTDEDLPVTTGNVLVNDSDADGDQLIINSFTQPAKGTVINNGDSTFTYTPAQNFNGNDSFSYTVDDGYGGADSASVIVTVNAVNDQPQAGDQHVSTSLNTPVEITLLVTDTDDDPLTYNVVLSTNHGILTGSMPNLIYTPNDNYIGFDFFTYTVNDASGCLIAGYVFISINENTAEFLPPIVSINATPTTIQKCGSATLSWSSEFADIITIDQGIGSLPLNSSIDVSPNNNTTYTISANGPGGSTTEQVLVEVFLPTNPISAPKLTVSVDSDIKRPGESVLLSWSSQKAQRITIDNGIGEVPKSGSLRIVPSGTTTYLFTATNTKGVTTTDCITVTITPPVVDLEILHNQPILEGKGDYLRWKVEDGNFASIDNNIGEVGFGTLPDTWNKVFVNPTEDTRFTLTAFGAGGETKKKLNMQVYPYFDSVKLMEVPLGSKARVAIEGNYLATSDSSHDVLIFKKEGTGWIKKHTIYNKHIDFIEISSVSISNNRLVIAGMPSIRNHYLDYYAFIFTRENENWIEEARFAENRGYSSNSWLEPPVADIDGDVVITIEQLGYSSAESRVHIYEWDGKNWNEKYRFDQSNHDRRYTSVSISGDYAVFGAPNVSYKVGYFKWIRGHIAIYKRLDAGNKWQYVRGFTPDEVREECFGTDVAIDGDQIIVGSSLKHYGGYEGGTPNPNGYVGSAFIYKRLGDDWDNWIQEAELIPHIGNGTYLDNPLVEEEFYFGQSVDIQDNFAVVGSYDERVNNVESQWGNTVYLFEKVGGIWKNYSRLDATGEVAVDNGTIAVGSGGVTNDYFVGEPERQCCPNWEVKVYDTAVEISATPLSIQQNGSSILSWSSRNAHYCIIEPEIGAVEASGSVTVSPIKTTTYTITAVGLLGIERERITVEIVPPPTVVIISQPSSIVIGESSTLIWNVAHADSVIIDPDIGLVNGLTSSLVSPLETTTYTVTVTGPGGTASDSVTVNVSWLEPTGNITANPASIIRGKSTLLTFATTFADTCSLEPGSNSVPCNGAFSVTPAEDTIYTIFASNPDFLVPVQASVTVDVTWPAPTVSINSSSILIGIGESTSLTWTSTDAETCVLDPGAMPVDCKNNNGLVVTPLETTTYTISAVNPDTQVPITSSVTVMVNWPQPTVSLNSDTLDIPVGGLTTLTWDTDYAQTITLEPGSVPLSEFGELVVTPTESTTYIITATGPGGTTLENLTINVYPQPTVTITASPVIILEGNTSNLSWSHTDATSVSIDQGIGDVTLLSSFDVSPTETTTYIITATGFGGSGSASVTVNVTYPPPTVDITATPQLIQANDPVILSWNFTEADTVVIDQVLEPIVSPGTIQVNPSETTLYTITATGRGGTAVGWVRVFVDEQGAYSYGDPTQAEQAHLEAINRTRANPVAEADRLNIELYEGLPEGTINSVPRQPLVMNSKLLQAASLHSQDMVDNDFSDHIAPTDGRDPYQRITDAGYQYGAVSENIGGRCNTSLTSSTAEGLILHDLLFIDAGVEGRGHRLNTLNNSYKEIGIGMAVGPHKGDPNCYLLTNDFAQSLTDTRSFVTGVVYEDINGDGQYTAGEGMGDVIIDVAGAGIQTATASAGGYGIPLDPGTYTLVASLPGGFTVSKDITIDDQNIKVDFLYNEFNVLAPTVTFTSDVYTIAPNDSATLSWESFYGYNVEIDNGINSVSDSGTTIVSPDVTTIYTIIVTGMEGTVTQSVTITVTDVPLPSVILRASPELIPLNGSSTLSWNSFYADSCEILPDIGQVPLPVDGSQEVSPASTTTYTLNCTGPGGTNLDTATVSYPTPTAQITATPAALLSGQSSDLLWQTNDATSYTINGIDTGTESGTMQVTPTTSIDYALSATGPGGTIVETVTVNVLDQQALGVGITFPADGAALSLPFTMVQGIVTPGNAEVGLMVNGVPVLREGNNFFVNALSLLEGENTITVAASSADGATTITNSIIVMVDTSQTTEWLTLSLIPETGVVPFSTTLYAKLNLWKRSISSSSLTYDGPGNIAITQVSLTEYDLEIDAPGMHTLSYQATDDLGFSFQQDIKVYVYDRVELSTMLQGKWNGMRASLSTGDINAALEVFSSNAKDMYSYNFNLLSSHLGEIASELQDITFIDMYDGEAEFEMLGEQDGVTYSFYVVFILDGDGVWRLRFF